MDGQSNRDTNIATRVMHVSRRSPGKVIGGLFACASLFPVILAAGAALRSGETAGPWALVWGWSVTSVLIVATLGSHPHPRFGPANAVTAARAAGVLILAVLALESDPVLPGPWIAAIGLAILLLDGLDGLLARRSGLVSAYGARFDVEVDAALTLVLALLAWRTGAAGPEIVLLAAPYYLFSAVRPAVPWLGAPLVPSHRRKTVCVAQVTTPIALLGLPIPAGMAREIVLLALAAILASFLHDIRRLAAQRP